MSIKNLLLGYGVFALLVFLYTGYTMEQGFPELYASDISIRYLYRANHIYLLFSALLILMYASSYDKSINPISNSLYAIVATVLIIAHIILIAAFFIEPQQASDNRPLSYYGVVITLTAVILGVFARLGQLGNKQQ
ncbi:MAG: hypothetical protein OEX12_06080 [Gammaproteobacteria bacterium]|nr:hypothetical protein [Gammaproteobacteria bacterium]